MIQDIAPHILDNSYHPVSPEDDDIVFSYDGNNILMKDDHTFFSWRDVKDNREVTYLCRIDNTNFFIGDLKDIAKTSLSTYNMRFFEPQELAFAAITGWQVDTWMKINTFCGKCGHPMQKDKVERAMRCPLCNNLVYPRIMPAVICGVINDKDEILVTKYAHGRYQKYALVAGFNEVGETIEETVKREVKEETGLDVSHLVYYKSQPWAFTSTLLFGFYARVIGSDAITMDKNELRVARWANRNEDIGTGGSASLTSEMIDNYLKGKIHGL